MASIFSKIIQGEIPCYKVAEDNNFFAFLDINPVAFGHTLVVPKKEIDYIFDLDEITLSGLMLFAQKVSVVLREEINCARIGLSVIGLEVPHTHVHLIPISTLEDMNFSKKRYAFEKDEYSFLAQKLEQKFREKFT